MAGYSASQREIYHNLFSRESICSREASNPVTRVTRTISIKIIFWLISISCIYSSSVHADPGFSFNSMPGKLVNIGTHRLHIYCLGNGRPVVIIDSGLGGFSLEWKKIQSSLSEKVMVCTYDRTGYGWSETGTEPRTTRQIVSELHSLLVKAEIPGPYILVGHSFGGYNIRYFASLYQESIAGLVLIDASHPDQLDRMPEPEVRPVNRNVNSITITRSIPVIPENYPEDVRQQAFIMMANSKAIQTYNMEWENFRLSANQVNQLNYLPDVPLTVITRGKRVWPHDAFGDESEKVWTVLQDELSTLTSQSTHLIASRSGHLVHLDEPELVISAIEKTVETAVNNEEIRIARLLQQKKSAEKTMLLVSLNHLRSSNNRYVNPLYGIVTWPEDIKHASFLMPQ